MEANPRNTRRILIQLLALVIACAAITIILISLGVLRPLGGTHRLVFRVESSGGYAHITLDAGRERIARPSTVTTPWEKVVMVDSGVEVYLTASNPTQTGKITCSITNDGWPWKKQTTAAPKDGVACAGIVP